jgi:hypothetical protein
LNGASSALYTSKKTISASNLKKHIHMPGATDGILFVDAQETNTYKTRGTNGNAITPTKAATVSAAHPPGRTYEPQEPRSQENSMSRIRLHSNGRMVLPAG